MYLKQTISNKIYLPCSQSDTGKHKRPETKAEKISRAVEGVRHMNTVIESPLERALTDKDLRRKYPEAAKLLREVNVFVVKLHYLLC